MITCIKCLENKFESEFKPNSKKCLSCYKIYQDEYRAKNKDKMKDYNIKYYQDNKEKILNSVKNYYEDNKEKVSDYKTKYWKENKDVLSKKFIEYYKINKEEINKKSKEYNQKNKDEINKKRNLRLKINRKKQSAKNRERRKSDPVYRLSQNIRTYLRNSFKFKGLKKNCKTELILGCSFFEFKLYMESQFEEWMTWDNYGLYNGNLNYGWEIDHIIPISSAKTVEEVISLNHYTNLRPLCTLTNRYIKSSKIIF